LGSELRNGRTRSVTKSAEVRFYIDADLLGLAKILSGLRVDMTYPGDPGTTLHRRTRPPCPITSPSMPDCDWLPRVTAKNWLIITRDRHIQDHTAEIAAVRDSGARLITLASDEAKNKFAQLEIFMCRWRDIERCLNQDGPFIYRATRSKLTPVDLGGTPPSAAPLVPTEA
jgi:PIN like domain